MRVELLIHSRPIARKGNVVCQMIERADDMPLLVPMAVFIFAADVGGITNVSYAFAGAQTIRLSFSDTTDKPTLYIGPKSIADPLPSTVTEHASSA